MQSLCWFLDLEKDYDKINRDSLWHVLRIHDVDGKLLNGIKSMYVNSTAYVRVKEVRVSVLGFIVV